MHSVIDILFQNPVVFFMLVVALVISLSVHEFAHALVSTKLGDPTAKYLGRLTLNPASHIDPIGMLLLVFAGFGWGKPVPFNASNLSHPKRDAAIIALAGPVSNLLTALVFSVLFHILPLTSGGFFSVFLYYLIIYNISLAVFNIIPVHPLDGFKVVYGLLPLNYAYKWLQLESYGPYILLGLVLTRTTSLIMNPVIEFFMTSLGLF